MSRSARHAASDRVLTRAWPRTFRLALLDKDLGVALRVLDATGTPTTAIRATELQALSEREARRVEAARRAGAKTGR